MKRIVCLLMVALMLLGLCACGKSASKADAVVDTNLPAPKGVSATVGSYENGVYTNEYLGVTCNLGEDWDVTLASDSELGNPQSQPLVAYDMSNGSGVLIQMLNMPGIDKNTGVDEFYTDMAVESLASGYETSGTVNSTEVVNVNFCGENVKAIYMDVTSMGVQMYIYNIYQTGLTENHVACYTVLALSESDAQQLLDLFQLS